MFTTQNLDSITKINKLLVIIGLLLVLFSGCAQPVSAPEVDDEPYYYEPVHVNTIEDYLRELISLSNIDDDDPEVLNIIERISRLDIRLLRLMYENGVDIRLFNGLLTDEPEMVKYRGVTPRGWENTGFTWDDIPGAGGQLVVFVRVGFSYPSIETRHSSMLLEFHEIAHTIDTLLGFISQSYYFQSIHEEEKNNVFYRIVYFDFLEEYFAEAFVKFKYDDYSRTNLRELAPRTYNFFVQMIEALP